MADPIVTLTTDFLMGQGSYFPPQVTKTDSHGAYSFLTWPGKKVLAVSNSIGWIFTPAKINSVDVNVDIPTYPPSSNGAGSVVTFSMGPKGPTISGENFYASPQVMSNKPQISPSSPWATQAKP